MIVGSRKAVNMQTKYEKIKTMSIEQMAKFLKEFSDFDDDWKILRLWLESDGDVLKYD